MHTMFSLGQINFDFWTLVSFLLGISVGFLVLFLIYLYAVLKSLNKNLKLRQTDEQDIDEEEIKWLIADAQLQFKDKKRRDEIGYPRHLTNLTRELSVDIAKKFYPKSKYPYLELTIDETLHLNHYITNRIDQLFSSRILKLFRGWTLSKIVEMNDVKSSIDNSAIMKTARKYNVGEVAKSTVAVINAVNPVYWIRKGIIEKSVNAALVKIGLAIIAITGEETYKIYSKKVFDVEKVIDTGVDKIYEELAEELKEAGDQK
ncbi:MAG: hypothetical protein EA375_06025 [Acholeplasmataceae bacterium]|nr:MAG: hypothetical protein EA375_06025 [Acholeplasmataceae bacterium]